MKQTVRKIISSVFKFLPEETPEYLYTVIFKPKIIRKFVNTVLRKLVDEKAKIREGFVALNKKDPVVSGAVMLGVYEEVESKLVRKKIRYGMTVIDIGANIGYYTTIFGTLVGNKGKVICFEPDKENFQFLKKTVELNGFTNTTLYNTALSDKVGEVDLYISPDNKGDHRIYDMGEERMFTKIKTGILDDYLESLGVIKVDFIKMDVQGVEWLVLKGMKKTLSSNSKISILTEFWPNGIKGSLGDPILFLNTLRLEGFKIHNINKKTGELELINNFKLFTDNIKGDMTHANLYCVKS